ncbi:galanin receptor type 2-like [Arapaima gigas]
MDDVKRLTGNNTMEELQAGCVERVLVPVLEALILVIGLAGHSLVLLILVGRPRRRGRQPHGTDTLLLALSVADLLLLMCLPFHTAAIALGHWPFGNYLCKAVSFLGAACSSASAFTLAALAVSRYLTVVHPTWTYRSQMQRWLRLVVMGLWVPAITLAAPQFAFRTVGPTTQLFCFAFLSDISQLIYSIIYFLIAFALPLAIIIAMYSKIYCFLHRRRREGRAPQLERYHNQVTRTSGLLVLAFTLCWLPSYVLMFSMLGHNTASRPRYGPVAILARLLALSSTVVNPILYVFMSQKFRADLLKVAKGTWCGICECCLHSRCCGTYHTKKNDPEPVQLETSPKT